MSAAPHYSSHRTSILERLTIAHVGIFLIVTTWGFGGNALWLRPELAVWGSAGALITLSVILGSKETDTDLRPLRWLVPFVLFNALVLISLETPGFRMMHAGSEAVFIPRSIPAWIPTAAVPGEAFRALWMFDAIYLACFNVLLVLRRRWSVRILAIIAVVNAFALSVFGTLQKLAGSGGLFFGSVKVRQEFFFASFIYHNHWAAFAVLMAGAGLGLAWRYARRSEEHRFSQSPGPAVLVAVFLIAATEPLCASRAGTMLMGLLLLGAGIHWLRQFLRRRRLEHASTALPLAAVVIALFVAGAGTWYIAGDTITSRVELTAQQVSAMRAEGTVGARAALYRDTWRMARSRPWFGWGMASYPYVFMIYNTQEPNRVDHLPVFYSAAHSDWLQALAEHGLVGTVLLGCCALVPLVRIEAHSSSRIRFPATFWQAAPWSFSTPGWNFPLEMSRSC